MKLSLFLVKNKIVRGRSKWSSLFKITVRAYPKNGVSGAKPLTILFYQCVLIYFF